MARITVTTDDGEVVEVFREVAQTTDDDTAIPERATGAYWTIFAQLDLAPAIATARLKDRASKA